MPLPDLIAIDPLERLPRAHVVVPGSKSITNRALILAALAEGETRLEGALWSEDTQVMVACLQQLGFSIAVEPDPGEPGNRILVVQGQSGAVPPGGSENAPLELHVGNAGTAARFLMAFLCLGQGCYRLAGIDRMHERPQSGLVDALRELGYRIDTENGRLPVNIFGGGKRSARCVVDISQSSQFASALILSGATGGWGIEFSGGTIENSPYVRMTLEMVKQFVKNPASVSVEPDASSGSYFYALNALGLDSDEGVDADGLRVQVDRWPDSGWQIDAEFPRFLSATQPISRESDLGDSIMTAIVLGVVAPGPREFRDLGRLRVQECERVEALRTELSRCGIDVVERGDSLIVKPGAPKPAQIETYNDHRMAMCFSVLALRFPGICIRHPRCVAKTFPTFFQKLATPPPFGLGAVIRDGDSNEQLEGDKLIAN